jgi:hypothetical protein
MRRTVSLRPNGDGVNVEAGALGHTSNGSQAQSVSGPRNPRKDGMRCGCAPERTSGCRVSRSDCFQATNGSAHAALARRGSLISAVNGSVSPVRAGKGLRPAAPPFRPFSPWAGRQSADKMGREVPCRIQRRYLRTH